ncbi:MAG TPA: hypothetical protein VH741_02530 [Candidatus Limnocylindrales bacterium]
MGGISGQPSGGHPFGQLGSPAPERGRSVGLLLLAGGLVGAIVLVVGYLLFFGSRPAPSPTPTAVAGSPTASAPTATTATASAPSPPSASATAPSDVAAVIDQVIAQMPAVRELEPTRDVPYVLLTRDEARAELEALLAEETDPERLAAEQRLLVRLGLLPADADLFELLVELQGSGVAAYYRTDTKTMYIIERDEPFSALDRVYVAHEYTHALQDMHFDLEGTRQTDPAEGDAALAQLAAIEGDASMSMLFWAGASLSGTEFLELLGDMTATPADQQLLDRMPPILLRQLTFPYNEGVAFSNQAYALGGWEAVNATLTDPPASTEQVLHPEKYDAREAPIPVVLDDLSADLGPGWQPAYEQTMGELIIQIWLADGADAPMPGLPLPTTEWQDAAAGWGGDRIAMYENGTDQWAIVWRLAWDEPTDSAQFEIIATRLLPLLDGRTEFGTQVIGDKMHATLLIASDQATLDRLDTAVRQATRP